MAPAPAPALALTRALRIAILACALSALAACSGAATEEARGLARQACTAPAPSVPAGFDARTASPRLLGELAGSAASRMALAERAAAEDARWQVLADASRAISSFAGLLRDARAVGAKVEDAVTPAMWDQYKYASDAFIVECRAAI